MAKNKESNPEKKYNTKKEYNPKERIEGIKAEIKKRAENAQKAQRILQQETAMITKLQGALEEASYALINKNTKK